VSTLLSIATFATLLAQWSHVHDYTVTIEARETLATRTQVRTLHYAFRAPDRSRMEVVAGPDTGGVLVWHGGSEVTAYRRGFPLIKIHADGHSPRVTSMRGNGAFNSDFGRVVACFEAHRGAVTEESGPLVDGKPTTAMTLTYAGFTCPDDPAHDRAVTRDVLYIDPDGKLAMRERFEGTTSVERWILRDLRIDPGVTDDELR